MITTVQPGKIPNSPETHFPLAEKGEKDNKSAHAPHPRQLQGCGVTVSFVGNCFANCKVLSQGTACCLNGEEFSASAVLAVRPADLQASRGREGASALKELRLVNASVLWQWACLPFPDCFALLRSSLLSFGP